MGKMIGGLREPGSRTPKEKQMLAEIFSEVDSLIDPAFDFGDMERNQMRDKIGELRGLVLK